MLSSRCPFCSHINPTGAKFCNECGSQLHEMRSEAPPVSLPTNTTAASPADSEPLPFRLDFLNEFPRPAPFAKEVTAAAQPSVASEPSFAASSPKPQPTWPAAAAQTSVASEPSFTTVSSSAPQLARLATVKMMDERRSTSRVAWAVSLLTVGLIVTGIFAYYVYSNAVHPGEGSGAPAISAGPEAVNSGASSIRPIQEIGPKASAPPASLATGSVAVSRTAPPAPPIEADGQTTSPKGPVSTPAASAAESAPSPPSDGRANIRDAPRPGACTQGLAALGLCGPNSKEGSK